MNTSNNTSRSQIVPSKSSSAAPAKTSTTTNSERLATPLPQRATPVSPTKGVAPSKIPVKDANQPLNHNNSTRKEDSQRNIYNSSSSWRSTAAPSSVKTNPTTSSSSDKVGATTSAPNRVTRVNTLANLNSTSASTSTGDKIASPPKASSQKDTKPATDSPSSRPASLTTTSTTNIKNPNKPLTPNDSRPQPASNPPSKMSPYKPRDASIESRPQTVSSPPSKISSSKPIETTIEPRPSKASSPPSKTSPYKPKEVSIESRPQPTPNPPAKISPSKPIETPVESRPQVASNPPSKISTSSDPSSISSTQQTNKSFYDSSTNANKNTNGIGLNGAASVPVSTKNPTSNNQLLTTTVASEPPKKSTTSTSPAAPAKAPTSPATKIPRSKPNPPLSPSVNTSVTTSPPSKTPTSSIPVKTTKPRPNQALPLFSTSPPKKSSSPLVPNATTTDKPTLETPVEEPKPKERKDEDSKPMLPTVDAPSSTTKNYPTSPVASMKDEEIIHRAPSYTMRNPVLTRSESLPASWTKAAPRVLTDSTRIRKDRSFTMPANMGSGEPTNLRDYMRKNLTIGGNKTLDRKPQESQDMESKKAHSVPTSPSTNSTKPLSTPELSPVRKDLRRVEMSSKDENRIPIAGSKSESFFVRESSASALLGLDAAKEFKGIRESRMVSSTASSSTPSRAPSRKNVAATFATPDEDSESDQAMIRKSRSEGSALQGGDNAVCIGIFKNYPKTFRLRDEQSDANTVRKSRVTKTIRKAAFPKETPKDVDSNVSSSSSYGSSILMVEELEEDDDSNIGDIESDTPVYEEVKEDDSKKSSNTSDSKRNSSNVTETSRSGEMGVSQQTMVSNKQKIVYPKTNYHIVILGGQCGKSCFLFNFIEDKYTEEASPTIEYTYYKTLIYDSEEANLNILDTSGDDIYVGLRKGWYKSGADGYVLFLSMCNRNSMKEMLVFNKELVKTLGYNPPRVIVATCADREKNRTISIKELQEVAIELNCPYYEVSSLSGYNVTISMQGLLREIKYKRMLAVINTPNGRYGGFLTHMIHPLLPHFLESRNQVYSSSLLHAATSNTFLVSNYSNTGTIMIHRYDGKQLTYYDHQFVAITSFHSKSHIFSIHKDSSLQVIDVDSASCEQYQLDDKTAKEIQIILYSDELQRILLINNKRVLVIDGAPESLQFSSVVRVSLDYVNVNEKKRGGGMAQGIVQTLSAILSYPHEKASSPIIRILLASNWAIQVWDLHIKDSKGVMILEVDTSSDHETWIGIQATDSTIIGRTSQRLFLFHINSNPKEQYNRAISPDCMALFTAISTESFCFIAGDSRGFVTVRSLSDGKVIRQINYKSAKETNLSENSNANGSKNIVGLNLSQRITCLKRAGRLLFVGTGNWTVAVYDFYATNANPLIEFSTGNFVPSTVSIDNGMILFRMQYLRQKEKEKEKERDKDKEKSESTILFWSPFFKTLPEV